MLDDNGSFRGMHVLLAWTFLALICNYHNSTPKLVEIKINVATFFLQAFNLDNTLDGGASLSEDSELNFTEYLSPENSYSELYSTASFISDSKDYFNFCVAIFLDKQSIILNIYSGHAICWSWS